MLKQLEDEITEYPARHSDLAAIRYYLQSLIWECDFNWTGQTQGITNYLTLLERIHRWGLGKPNVMFVTFNYDRQFEIASSHFATGGRHGLTNGYSTLDSYIDGSMLKLIKPHGSIDWGYRVVGGLPRFPRHPLEFANLAMVHAAGLKLADIVEKTNEHPPQPTEQHGFIPGIAIPVDQKSVFVCPPPHLQELRKGLADVTHILTIGWRGLEGHFTEILSMGLPNTPVSALAVSGDIGAGREALSHINSPGGVHQEAFHGGFTSFVTHPKCDEFLRDALKGS